MFQKNCYICNRPSFSSCEVGHWLCPTCGQDLTNQKAFNPERMSQFTHKMRNQVAKGKPFPNMNSGRYDGLIG